MADGASGCFFESKIMHVCSLSGKCDFFRSLQLRTLRNMPLSKAVLSTCSVEAVGHAVGLFNNSAPASQPTRWDQGFKLDCHADGK